MSFVNDTWFVLQIRGENDKPNTIAFYKNMTRIISEYFKGSVLQEISPVDIQKYLVYPNLQNITISIERQLRNYFIIVLRFGENIAVLCRHYATIFSQFQIG